MKKLIGAAFLSAVIAMGITAYANDSLTLSSMSTEGAVVSYSGTENHTLYAAVYRNGALSSVKKTNAASIAVEAEEGNVKVFCWDDNMKPLTESLAFDMKPAKVNDITGYSAEAKLVVIGGNDVTINDDFSGYVNKTPIADEVTAGELVTGLYDDTLSEGENILLIDLLTDDDPASYDMIALNKYGTAVVDEITEKSDGTKKLYFTDQTEGMRSMLDLGLENVSYIASLDGKEIDLKDIQSGDVLSIKYNPYEAFTDSEYYDITVSRGTINGFCTAANEYKTAYTFGGREYEAAATYPQLDIKEPYTVYLDVFGRIAYADLNIYERNIGILTNIYKKADNKWYASIITREGKTEELSVPENTADVYAMEYLKAGAWNENGVTYDTDMGLSKLNLYPSQVIQYYIDPETNELEIMRECSKWNSEENEYKASSGRMGIVKVDNNATILDITEIEENDTVNVMQPSDLVDGGTYSAYGYEVWNSKHTFIIITEIQNIPDTPIPRPGGDNYPDVSDTYRMAIFKSSQKVVDNGAERTQWTVASGGEEYSYIVNETVASTTGTAFGDPFIIDIDTNDEISKAVPVFQASNLLGTTFNEFSSGAVQNGFSSVLSQPSGEYWNNMFPSNGSWNQDIIFGVLVDKSGDHVTLCDTLEDGKYINVGKGRRLYGIGTNALVYTYIFHNGTANAVTLDDGVEATPKLKEAMTTNANGDDLLDITSDMISDDVVFAIARVEDDELIELYQIYYE